MLPSKRHGRRDQVLLLSGVVTFGIETPTAHPSTNLVSNSLTSMNLLVVRASSRFRDDLQSYPLVVWMKLYISPGISARMSPCGGPEAYIRHFRARESILANGSYVLDEPRCYFPCLAFLGPSAEARLIFIRQPNQRTNILSFFALDSLWLLLIRLSTWIISLRSSCYRPLLLLSRATWPQSFLGRLC